MCLWKARNPQASRNCPHVEAYTARERSGEGHREGLNPPNVSVIECFETDGGVNYRSDWLIFFNLCGFRLMLQATFLDGVPFDPFSFQQDSWATSEVDVGRR